MRRLLLFLFLPVLVFKYNGLYAQEKVSYTWIAPDKSKGWTIEGRGWNEGLQKPYDRLPARAEGLVRKEVWNLSHHTAGMLLRFESDASEIVVRYSVTGKQAMPHMPSTGVSGTDLYALDTEGRWLWVRGKYEFGDTITYRFRSIDKIRLKEYRLYLPLYKDVRWLEIGVPANAVIKPLAARGEKPVVVYGTSIAQGACASRPGMAWASILERSLNKPVINLGFSGNGRMESEMADLINELDAEIYILDCLPNMGGFTPEVVRERLMGAVKKIRQKHPSASVILAEHPCAAISSANSAYEEPYKRSNARVREVFSMLEKDGVKNVYLLTSDQIGFSADSTVDGTHPSDLGMMQYAVAYEKIIRTVYKGKK